jgi:hypothetical protein
VASWREIIDEARALGGTYDVIRRRHLKELSDLTDRNAIVYYSAWLQKADWFRQGVQGFSVDDSDKNGFMAAIHKLDRSKGLDLILHTPGGDLAAAESLIDYLRMMFDDNIRAVVPQLSMSAGTIMALSAHTIIMGKHSSLGPIDPQFGGTPAHGVIEEFERARREIAANPASIPLWQPIIGKYPPTFVGQCEKAVEWAAEIAENLLVSGMFKTVSDPDERSTKARAIVRELTDNLITKSHARHVSVERAREIGLEIAPLEDDQDLQEAVLTVHHSCIQTLSETPTVKLIENQNGDAYIVGAKVEAAR